MQLPLWPSASPREGDQPYFTVTGKKEDDNGGIKTRVSKERKRGCVAECEDLREKKRSAITKGGAETGSVPEQKKGET